MRRLWGTAAISAALGVAACADAVAVKRSEIAGGYTGWVWVQTLAQNGTNAVAIRNSPFPDTAVLAALQTRYSGAQYRFGLGRPADWNGYTVIIGFGRPAAGTGDLCKGQTLLPADPGKMTVTAAYCYGDILLTEAQGWTGAADAAEDWQFTNLVGALVAELFAD